MFPRVFNFVFCLRDCVFLFVVVFPGFGGTESLPSPRYLPSKPLTLRTPAHAVGFGVGFGVGLWDWVLGLDSGVVSWIGFWVGFWGWILGWIPGFNSGLDSGLPHAPPPRPRAFYHKGLFDLTSGLEQTHANKKQSPKINRETKPDKTRAHPKHMSKNLEKTGNNRKHRKF